MQSELEFIQCLTRWSIWECKKYKVLLQITSLQETVSLAYIDTYIDVKQSFHFAYQEELKH
jgi:hypothetical protein